MKKLIILFSLVLLVLPLLNAAILNEEVDKNFLQKVIEKTFPDYEPNNFANKIYSIENNNLLLIFFFFLAIWFIIQSAQVNKRGY